MEIKSRVESRSVFHLICFILGDREKSMSARDDFAPKQTLEPDWLHFLNTIFYSCYDLDWVR